MGCGKSKADSTSTPAKTTINKKLTENFKVTHRSFIIEKIHPYTQDYDVIETIGKGGYGEVKKVMHKKTGIIRACKIIEKSEDPEKMKRFTSEVDILKNSDHPNIMKIIEFYQDPKMLYIVSEYFDGGELFEKITSLAHFTEFEAAQTMKDILSAVSYLHKHQIVHMDLKPENILYESKDSDAVIKLIDFGTSQMFDAGSKLTKAFGTAYYVAPEVLKKEYNEKCDVWSCGVIMYILLCGHPPFNGNTEKKILEKVLKGLYEFKDHEWAEISEEAQNLIKKMLTYDVSKRISAVEALNDPWFDMVLGQKKIIDKKNAIKTLDNLKSFRAERKLQQATMIYLANYFSTKEEKNKMLEVFKIIDKDGDGILTRDEIIEGYKYITGKSQNQKQIDEIIRNIDVNNSGAVDYSEFVTATINREKILSNERIEKAFKLFDADGNGYLSIDELKHLLDPGDRGDDLVLKEVLLEVDTNNDGKVLISLSEFKDMLLKIGR